MIMSSTRGHTGSHCPKATPVQSPWYGPYKALEASDSAQTTWSSHIVGYTGIIPPLLPSVCINLDHHSFTSAFGHLSITFNEWCQLSHSVVIPSRPMLWIRCFPTCVISTFCRHIHPPYSDPEVSYMLSIWSKCPFSKQILYATDCMVT